MRIGELLDTRMSEVNLREKRLTIMEAQKTGVGRVAYLSEDACKALKVWLKRRDPEKEYLFYGQGRQRLSYTAVRMRFARYLEKAGLAHKGYSLHCLRHTCATELLNAGMRLECLQQLLGHSSIEMTRRYARLTDNTRREEYFRAMAHHRKGRSLWPLPPPILNYRRFLKRRNYSGHTIKNYMHTLKQFVVWVDVPIEAVTHKKLLAYLDHLLDRGLQPKTINCHLDSIRGFYHYLIEEEQVAMVNPVKRGYALRLSRPLPRHLRDEEVGRLLKVVHHQRDRAMVMLMLRCGLRVEEVSRLKLAALDLRRSQVFVHQGKGAKDRVVYLSDDAYEALVQYLRVRPASRIKEVFLVDKGQMPGQGHLGAGHPKTPGALRPPGEAQGVVPPAPAHHGHPTPQCRCRPGDHPGPPGAYPDQDHPAVLPGVQSQGTAGLSPGHGGDSADNWMIPTMKKPSLTHRTRQGAPAPTSNLGPILAGAPCLGYPGKEGSIKNRLTRRK